MTSATDNRTTELTATDRLRAMLDERGVRWIEATPSKTKWYSPVLNGPVAVSEWNGKLVLDAGYVNVTPEQAIAATLGGGKLTAEQVRDDSAKKLKEDVIGRATLSYYGDGNIRLDSSYMDRASLADVFDWLDRQAAITERENDGLKANDGTRWHKLFGTPERMARTMIAANKECETAKPCYHGCPFSVAPTCPRNCWPDDYDALLEWLKQEVDA